MYYRVTINGDCCYTSFLFYNWKKAQQFMKLCILHNEKPEEFKIEIKSEQGEPTTISKLTKENIEIIPNMEDEIND